MISFECDYNNGAHPKVLENLVKYNDAKPTPYGFDEFSERAKQRIREAIGMPDAQIFFLTGGTQTNATTIDSMLYQYEGVICVGSGHINVHEAGAVEFTEHKIITITDNNGKTRTTPYIQDWCISPSRQNLELSILPRSSTTFIRFASSMRYLFILMAPVWAMV